MSGCEELYNLVLSTASLPQVAGSVQLVRMFISTSSSALASRCQLQLVRTNRIISTAASASRSRSASVVQKQRLFQQSRCPPFPSNRYYSRSIMASASSAGFGETGLPSGPQPGWSAPPPPATDGRYKTVPDRSPAGAGDAVPGSSTLAYKDGSRTAPTSTSRAPTGQAVSGLSKNVWNQHELRPRHPKLTSDINADVCVVGGGIAGLTAAYVLARAGGYTLCMRSARMSVHKCSTMHILRSFVYGE